MHQIMVQFGPHIFPLTTSSSLPLFPTQQRQISNIRREDPPPPTPLYKFHRRRRHDPQPPAPSPVATDIISSNILLLFFGRTFTATVLGLIFFTLFWASNLKKIEFCCAVGCHTACLGALRPISRRRGAQTQNPSDFELFASAHLRPAPRRPPRARFATLIQSGVEVFSSIIYLEGLNLALELISDHFMEIYEDLANLKIFSHEAYPSETGVTIIKKMTNHLDP